MLHDQLHCNCIKFSNVISQSRLMCVWTSEAFDVSDQFLSHCDLSQMIFTNFKLLSAAVEYFLWTKFIYLVSSTSDLIRHLWNTVNLEFLGSDAFPDRSLILDS